MSGQRRHKVAFTAQKKVSKPVKVEFYSSGGKISFTARKQVVKPVKVEFYAKKMSRAT